MFPGLTNVQKFLVSMIFPIAAIIIPAVTAADFTSTSGLITFVTGLLTSFGVWVVPNTPKA